jgi:hypothetical protein
MGADPLAVIGRGTGPDDDAADHVLVPGIDHSYESSSAATPDNGGSGVRVGAGTGAGVTASSISTSIASASSNGIVSWCGGAIAGSAGGGKGGSTSGANGAVTIGTGCVGGRSGLGNVARARFGGSSRSAAIDCAAL